MSLHWYSSKGVFLMDQRQRKANELCYSFLCVLGNFLRSEFKHMKALSLSFSKDHDTIIILLCDNYSHHNKTRGLISVSYQDSHSQGWCMTTSCWSWIGFRLDSVCVLFIVSVVAGAFYVKLDAGIFE